MTKKNGRSADLRTVKGLLMIAAVLLVAFVVSGCASIAMAPDTFYSDIVTVGAKRGEDTSKVWLGIFGTETFPPADRVAKDNGINKIATVEHYVTPGILNLWMDYKTIVTGE